MANRSLQSFDAITDLNAFFSTSTAVIQVGGARTGANCLQTGNGSLFSFGANETVLTFGCGFFAGGGGNGNPPIQFVDGTGDSNSFCIGVNVDPSNRFTVMTTANPGFGGALFTSSVIHNAGVWDFVELTVVIHPSAGSFTLRINGIVALTQSGIRTTSQSNTAFTTGLHFFNATIDDFYLNDATTANNNSFMGPVRIYPIVPTADAAPLQWSPSTAGSHFSKVNGLTSQTATFVQDSTVNDVDQYVYSSAGLPAGTLAKALQLNIYAGLDTPGTRQITAEVRSGGTTVDRANPATLSATGFKYFAWNWDVDPITGLPLSNSSIDNNTFGPKVTA